MALVPRRSVPAVRTSKQPRRRLPCRPQRLAGAKLREAVDRCNESLRRELAEGHALGVAACYLEIGDLYLACGEAERAEEMYRRSLAASRRAAEPSRADVFPAP